MRHTAHPRSIATGLLLLAACASPPAITPPDGRFKAEGSRPRPPLVAAEGEGGKLTIDLFDLAGTGEAVLVRCPCPGAPHRLLIDAGAADAVDKGGEARFQKALGALIPAGESIDVALVSHEDPAHLGGVPWLLETYRVGMYVDNGRTARNDATWNRAEEALRAFPPPYYVNVRREGGPVVEVDFCPRTDVTAEVLRPAGFGHTRFADEASLIVRVVHGEAVALLTGDAGREQEESLLRDPLLTERLRCDLLKVGNGGDRASSTPAFLAAAQPRIAAIACPPAGVGKNRQLGHPTKVVLDRLAKHLQDRPGGKVTLRVCDDTAPPPAQTDELGEPIPEPEGVTMDIDWAGTWRDVEIDRAVWLTAGMDDLRFESDGRRFGLAE